MKSKEKRGRERERGGGEGRGEKEGGGKEGGSMTHLQNSMLEVCVVMSFVVIIVTHKPEETHRANTSWTIYKWVKSSKSGHFRG